MGDPRSQLTHAGKFFGMHQGFLGLGQLLFRLCQAGNCFPQFVNDEGQAHFVFSQSLMDGDSMFATGFVAASPTIQFVFRGNFAQMFQYGCQFFR
ncbi:MAG: hypothetical protein BWX80_01247 [Candidatus Hydrogenedentes bacterium ADurb.Bin101]|nr:MAG: hypothetical protein BWX80_01247 [Candidatus Hydrogenedentes bacterium ADurb.Bin101]